MYALLFGATSPLLPIDTSEFFDSLLQLILKSIYDPLYKSLEKSFNDIFSILNYEVSKTSGRIIGGPAAWNQSAYSIIQSIAEDVCIPIAAAFITVIFCWELIHLVQESNSMQNVSQEKIFLVLMKFALCMFVCAYSFKIVMGFYDIGAMAAKQVTGRTSIQFSGIELEDLGLIATPTEYTVGMLMQLAGYKIILFVGKLGIMICSMLIYIRSMFWFVEFLLYASVAPIPYSTWVNKEWGQVGMNYTRKMLAYSFEGFLILLLFTIYGGVMSGLRLGDFTQSMVMILGSGFALAVMMFKTHNISASIFNAH